MKKPVKKLSIALAVIVLLFLAVMFGGGAYMVNYALCPSQVGPEKVAYDRSWQNERYPVLEEWIDSLEASGILKDTTVIDDEGFRISAYYAAAESKSAKTAVIVHGYTDNPMKIMMIGRMFRDSLSYNVLIPHLNYHGFSEGDAIQMGWKDRLDVMQWMNVAHEIFRDSIMVVHGISMGAATTMMVSGEELPDYVKGFIEDCGYSSVWNQFKKELKEQFGLPPFPILYGADLVCRMKYGWGFKEASSLKQLAKCTRPMLFIHGDDDDFVPTSDIYLNYDAKVNGYKEMWLSEDTKHALSYANHPQEYTVRVRAFLNEYVEK